LFHISHWEAWVFVWGGGLNPPKSRGEWTGYHQTSISKTVLPKHVRWDIGILDAQQWLLRLTFDGNCVEQLYSAQPLPSCTTISIILFDKTLNHNHIQATFSKLFLLKWIFLWLQMLNIPLNKDFYEIHAAYRLVLTHSACSSNRYSELKVTHANTPTALPRFKNVIFRHHYVMQKNSSCIETEQRYLSFIFCVGSEQMQGIARCTCNWNKSNS